MTDPTDEELLQSVKLNQMSREQGIYRLSTELAELDRQVNWQPIETAPKDRSLLICGGTWSSGDYIDMEFTGVGIANWYQDHWRGEDRSHNDWDIHEPKYWMPLPEPPK